MGLLRFYVPLPRKSAVVILPVCGIVGWVGELSGVLFGRGTDAGFKKGLWLSVLFWKFKHSKDRKTNLNSNQRSFCWSFNVIVKTYLRANPLLPCGTLSLGFYLQYPFFMSELVHIQATLRPLGTADCATVLKGFSSMRLVIRESQLTSVSTQFLTMSGHAVQSVNT